MQTFHVTLAADDRQTLFIDERQRCAAATALARVGGDALLLFCAVDDHVHLVLRGEARRVAQMAGNASQALRWIGRVGLEPARIRPVASRVHLHSLVRYVLDQSTHHALATATHPARWSGSCFWDLVGARRLPGFGPGALQASLPRLSRSDVWGAVGLPPLEPASDATLGSVSAPALYEAGAAAVGTVSLDGRGERTLAARTAVAHLARRLGFADAAAREALGCAERTHRRLLARPNAVADERAIRLQIALRHVVGAVESARRIA
ncbi:MAG: hypothetical protein H6738_24390 [Alphaproteobacteria bacterium]|nr:hypothetical protein [Alphaproteobacteria bacterium]